MDIWDFFIKWQTWYGDRQVSPHEAAGLLGTRDVLVAQSELMAIAGRELGGYWLAVHNGGDGWPRFGLRGPRCQQAPVGQASQACPLVAG